MRGPTKAELIGIGNWFRKDFAEWFVGSWAKIISWMIVGVIFFSFLQMDGYFSRGLGEGSGVDEDLFMHIGWMFRFFAAVFLTLAVKFTSMGMKDESVKLKVLGAFCTVIIIAHAMGFGLKALEGKRANAVAITEVAQVVDQSNENVIAQLRKQIAEIDTQLNTALAPINSEIARLDNDKIAANDARSDNLRVRRTTLEDEARIEKREINGKITGLIETGGVAKQTATKDSATTEKWAPLFVGLAQLVTWSQNPSDWAIYLCGVGFLMCWILLGDSIVILVPPALYKMHLRDAQRKKYAEMGAKGGKRTAHRNRVRGKMLAIEDYSKEKAKETRADLDAEPEDEDVLPPDPEAPADGPDRDIDLTSEEADADSTGRAQAA